VFLFDFIGRNNRVCEDGNVSNLFDKINANFRTIVVN